MINALISRHDLRNTSKRLYRRYTKFNQLIDELNTHDIPKAIVRDINEHIEALNKKSTTDENFIQDFNRMANFIIDSIENRLLLSTKNYYRNLWINSGLTVIGIPLGVALVVVLNNLYYIGLGLPLGVLIGLLIGTNMDRKLINSNRQLDVEI